MSSKEDSNASAEKCIAIPIKLLPDNYLAWRDSAYETCGEKYGRVADVLMTNKAYEVPEVKPEDYTPTHPISM